MSLTMVRKINSLERNIKNAKSITDRPMLAEKCNILIERCNNLRSEYINNIRSTEEIKIDRLKRLEKDIDTTIKTIETFLSIDKRIYNHDY